ncbi:anthranilate synthase family protein [Acrocarpospora catenulata]|uniref:anthranilate synthase family protein n=1 Tax=Acrocarpospora catenulata TaxID=2836182 RepID=UPI0027E15DFA|nr:anthranilate synthase family protein [Acrocarpospora catenulata]
MPATPFVMERLADAAASPFAMLYRPTSNTDVEVLLGESMAVPSLADIPDGNVLVSVPYRQLTERALPCPDDGAPLLALRIHQRATVPVADALRELPADEVPLTDGGFDLSDPDYAGVVRSVLTYEIGRGRGANFVIKRVFQARIPDYSLRSALSIFAKLLKVEQGAYWTFLVHTGDLTLVGASPELHIGLRAGVVTMNPISGTYRYPRQGPDVRGVLDFLADQKESDELSMVLDEELKTMARICPSGGRVIGPRIREMAKLAHTEYLLSGITPLRPLEVLRQSLFAPTVVGSPLESACEVVARYEPGGRSYYSGVLALIGDDEHGRPTMDSTILIRCAEIDRGGNLRVGVGATLVRHSDPDSEVAETKTKLAGLLSAFDADRPHVRGPVPSLSAEPSVRQALGKRSQRLSPFWRMDQHRSVAPRFPGHRVLIVNAEDDFALMLGQQLSALGLRVTVRDHTDHLPVADYDLVVLGPGPGDPLDRTDPRIAVLHDLTNELLRSAKPMLAVCLSHQILASVLGLPVIRMSEPNQGRQRTIKLLGAEHTVAFYNSFVARCPRTQEPELVQVVRDDDSDEVHALLGPAFASLQFHPESVLSLDGPRLLGDVLAPLLPARRFLTASAAPAQSVAAARPAR